MLKIGKVFRRNSVVTARGPQWGVRHPIRRILCAIMPSLAVCAGGCVFGPTALRMSRSQYNEAINQTTNEQLLLNLVRLRYRDVPFMLEVGSVSAQFELRQEAGVTGTLNENVGPNPINPDVLELSGAAVFVDRPTVTFTPVQGQEFVQRLATPLSLDTVVLLQRSGWSSERVFRLTVQQMNGLDNATRATGPTPDAVPPYRDFERLCRLIRSLTLRRQLTFGYVTEDEPLSAPVPAAAVDGQALVAAARDGFKFTAVPDGGYLLTGPRPRLRLSITEQGLETDEAREMFSLLGLNAGQAHFDVTQSGAELSVATAPAGERKEIFIATRALLGMMFFLSHGIEVPPAHERAGLVTVTRDEAGQPFDWTMILEDQFHVRSRRMPPRSASVAVKHRGYWFYIPDDDLNTKATFMLLSQVITLQAGVEAGGGPVLTLPVGG